MDFKSRDKQLKKNGDHWEMRMIKRQKTLLFIIGMASKKVQMIAKTSTTL